MNRLIIAVFLMMPIFADTLITVAGASDADDRSLSRVVFYVK